MYSSAISSNLQGYVQLLNKSTNATVGYLSEDAILSSVFVQHSLHPLRPLVRLTKQSQWICAHHYQQGFGRSRSCTLCAGCRRFRLRLCT